MAGFSSPRLLRPEDDLSGFSCGCEAVDRWARSLAHKAMEANTSRVYLCHASDGRLAGLYSLSTYAIERTQDVAGRLRRNAPRKIPCTLLGMFGVSQEFQALGVGGSLLRDAFVRAQGAATVVASRALIVEPADERAVAFYAHYGFAPMDSRGRMYLKF